MQLSRERLHPSEPGPTPGEPLSCHTEKGEADKHSTLYTNTVTDWPNFEIRWTLDGEPVVGESFAGHETSDIGESPVDIDLSEYEGEIPETIYVFKCHDDSETGVELIVDEVTSSQLNVKRIYTQEELEAMTKAEILALAVEEGYEMTTTEANTKAEIIADFLAQQEQA